MKILVVQPSLDPPGGGNLVSAWMIEALRAEHRVTLLAWKTPDLPACNEFFGTSLAAGDFELRLAPAVARGLARVSPTPAWLLMQAVLLRHAATIARDYDVVISASNEADLGRRAIQYVHYPRLDPVRPADDLRWYHGSEHVLRLYYRLGAWIGGASPDGVRANLTLVNSDFIGRRMRVLHGVTTETLHPPVPGDFPTVPWEARANGLVAIGRITPAKRFEDVVEVARLVRAAGHDLSLHLIGSDDDREYARRIRGLVRDHAAWASLHHHVPRAELLRIVGRQRYGIHVMAGEHFGIAVAEMVRAGCVVFVADGGGPLEIVGDDERLRFGSPAEAAEKIAATLGDDRRQSELRAHLARRATLFSVERFTERLRGIVRDFAAGC